MISKKIIYELYSSALNTLCISLEEEGTAIVFTSHDEYVFTLSVSELKELWEILTDILNETNIVEDTIKDKE